MTKKGKVQQHRGNMTITDLGGGGERWFESILTSDIVDRQGEVLDPAGFTLKEYRDILGAPIMDTHSNIQVGRFIPESLQYCKVKGPDGKEYNAIKGRGVIFQAPEGYEQYPVWDEVWDHIKTHFQQGNPSGVSIGGDPDPEMGKQVRCNSDGCHIFVPKVYWSETSVVRDGKGPANPTALNSGINAMAKAQMRRNDVNVDANGIPYSAILKFDLHVPHGKVRKDHGGVGGSDSAVGVPVGGREWMADTGRNSKGKTAVRQTGPGATEPGVHVHDGVGSPWNSGSSTSHEGSTNPSGTVVFANKAASALLKYRNIGQDAYDAHQRGDKELAEQLRQQALSEQSTRRERGLRAPDPRLRAGGPEFWAGKPQQPQPRPQAAPQPAAQSPKPPQTPAPAPAPAQPPQPPAAQQGVPTTRPPMGGQKRRVTPADVLRVMQSRQKGPVVKDGSGGSFAPSGTGVGLMTTGSSGSTQYRVNGQPWQRRKKTRREVGDILAKALSVPKPPTEQMPGHTEEEGMAILNLPPVPANKPDEYQEAILDWVGRVGGPVQAEKIVAEELMREEQFMSENGRISDSQGPSGYLSYLFRLMMALAPPEPQVMEDPNAAPEEGGEEGGAAEEPDGGDAPSG